MSSAFKFAEFTCWGTTGAIEDILSRTADLSVNTSGANNPMSTFLVQEREEYWGGKVIDFPKTAFSPVNLAPLLESARQQALDSGTFTGMGMEWLKGPLADFCKQIGGRA